MRKSEKEGGREREKERKTADPILINVPRRDRREAIKLPDGANGQVKRRYGAGAFSTFNPMNGTSARSLRVV